MATADHQKAEAPAGLKGSHDKNVGWYDPPITSVEEPTRELLEQYAQIPRDEVIPRLLDTRDRIWEVFPFPCVGQFRFVQLNLYRQKSYAQLVQRLKDGARYLDVGCCCAQDLRKLVLDGAPSDNTWAIELNGGFIPLAYDFFGDRETLKTRFLVGDLLDKANPDLVAAKLEGTVDIIHVGMVLHLWDLEGQTQFCERLVEFFRPAPGSTLVGCSAGRVNAAEWPNPVGKSMFKHNVESFAAMWDEVGRRTGTQWKTEGWLDRGAMESNHWDDQDARKLFFEVTRL